MGEFVESLGTGRQQPRQLVRMARTLHEKHPEDSGYSWWASLGGTDFTNVERDLRRRTRKMWGHDLEPMVIPITVANDDGSPRTTDLACLAPHEVFSAVASFGDQFAVSFIGDQEPDKCV
jgi:hypothetical protein